MDDQVVEEIVARHRGSLGGMLSILAEVQAKYGYLPQDALRRIAAATGGSLADIYAVATFYKAFSLRPRGRHLVSVCLGTACHVRGAQKIADEFSRQLGVAPGETTLDKEFSLETVNCLGACALGPTVVVDHHYFRHVTTAKVQHILEQARGGFAQSGADVDHRVFPIRAGCPRCGHTLMDDGHMIQGRASIRLAASSAGKAGAVCLSAFYGSPDAECDAEIPDGALTSLSCPHCGQELSGESSCSECGATMATMTAGTYAAVHICPRRGCPGHRLDLLNSVPRTCKKGNQE
ncbi:MAG: NAD(P)H-dependent oxidoreductase subunit E [Phycisphaerae bacterium]|nr:NAD(P)H-dependent oxidoreductase subunit E [Phycisphaerae bacterium]